MTQEPLHVRLGQKIIINAVPAETRESDRPEIGRMLRYTYLDI